MNCKFKHIWLLTALVADVINPVNVQYAMPVCPPMFPAPPPMFPMPVPAPMPIIAQALCPMPIPGNMSPSQSSSTTSTTTTQKPDTIAVAMPVPVPMPMPVPMPVPMGVPVYSQPNSCQGPAPRPKNCPPCPPCVCSPSCTPSFYSYCSPCHLKCRCRNKEDAPEPLPPRAPQAPAYGMPVPMPAMPPPVVVVPYPPPIPIPIRQDRHRPRKDRLPKYSSCSSDSTESSSSSETDYKRKRKNKKKKRYGGFRRNLRSSEGENEIVKPMLSYVADNGDVKFKTKISGDDVAELLGEKKAPDKQYQTVQVMASEDENKKPNLVVLSKRGGNQKHGRYKKVFLRGGVSNQVLEDGKKELVFRPPGNKKISNLSVSFLIS